MKQVTLLIALLGTVMSAAIHASEFEGHYVGLNIGKNSASQTSKPDKNSTYLGVRAGYNWDLRGVVLGAEAFADNHTDSYTKRDAGVDGRFGVPMNRWMPYVKLGVAASSPGIRAHGGLGVEYKLGNRWSICAEWTTDSKDVGGVMRKNNNTVIGLNFLLDRHAAKTVLAANDPATAAAPERAGAAAAETGTGGDNGAAKHVYKFFSSKPATSRD